jgi:hypothetical protein
MPPRLIVALIIAFWVGSIAYLIYDEYYPWWRTDAPPPFLVELADEASPLQAEWSIYRGGQKIGSASTLMTCLKDDTVELTCTIENLDLNVGLVQARIIKHYTVQRVTRDGQLVTLFSRLHFVMTALGMTIEIRSTVNGHVRDGKLHATSKLDSPFGRSTHELEPIPLNVGNILNPMQPIPKVRVRPGQHWKITSVDPLGEVINVSLQRHFQQVTNGKGRPAELKLATPKSLLARVGSETREWNYRGKTVACLVIEYRSDDREVTGSTWVSEEDGKVLRQVANNLGENLIMERDH